MKEIYQNQNLLLALVSMTIAYNVGALDDTIALHPNGPPLVKHRCLCVNKILMFYNIKEKDH